MPRNTNCLERDKAEPVRSETEEGLDWRTGRDSLSAAVADRVRVARDCVPKVTSMPDQNRPLRPAVSPTSAGTSDSSAHQEKEQLSHQHGVRSSVSTAAMDRGVLMAALGPRPAGGLEPAMAGAES